jgi:PleD family two-component response regulator
LSKSLQGTIRSDNKIYRYNEKHNMEGVFCVVFNRMDRQGAYLAAGRVRGRVEASKLVYAEKVIGVTLSAVIVPHKAGDSYQLLCTRAEKALESIELKDKNSIYVIED